MRTALCGRITAISGWSSGKPTEPDCAGTIVAKYRLKGQISRMYRHVVSSFGFLRHPRTLKFLLTAVLLLALGSLVDWRKVFAISAQARPEWLMAAAACILTAHMVICWRWMLIMRVSSNVPVRARRFGSVFVMVSGGLGFGALLPTAMGADLARGMLLRTRGGDGARPGFIVSSLLLDRYAAVLGTLVVASAGSLAAGHWFLSGMLVVVFAMATGVALAVATQSDALLDFLMRGPLRRFRPKLEVLMSELRTPGMLRRGLGPAVLVSMILTLVRTGVFICVYQALGSPVPLGQALVTIPVMLIALMAPVTIGGFGLREWILAVGFADAGVPAVVSVSAGLIFYGLQILVSLPSMLWALLSRPRGYSASTKEGAQ